MSRPFFGAREADLPTDLIGVMLSWLVGVDLQESIRLLGMVGQHNEESWNLPLLHTNGI